jgi:hypothetical protein
MRERTKPKAKSQRGCFAALSRFKLELKKVGFLKEHLPFVLARHDMLLGEQKALQIIRPYLREWKNVSSLRGGVAAFVFSSCRVCGVQGRVVSLENGPSLLRGGHLRVVVVQRLQRGSELGVVGGPYLQAVQAQGSQGCQNEARS